jgi:tellurite resistance protein
LAKALVVLALAVLVFVPFARADGDPASDYLLQQVSFVPPDTALSAYDTAQLNALLHAARAAGYTVHVALIASQYDMGSVTVLFKQPKLYAPFLSQELKFYYKGRALVVMPNGYAIARDGHADPAEQAVLDTLALPSPFAGATLAAAAERAVRALAAHAGVKVSALPKVQHGSTSSANEDRIFIGVGALVVLALAGGAAFWRRRRGLSPT